MALTKIPANMLSGVDLGNSVRVNLGSSNNLALFHTGGNGVIHNTTGALRIRANTLNIQDYTNEDAMITATSDGSVDLYHNNQKKFETTSTGATVTGNLAVTGDLDITGNINSTSVTDLDVTDKTISMAQGTTTSVGADNAGIIINGPTNNASLLWDHTNQYLEFNKDVFTPAGFIIGTTGTKVGRMYNNAGVMALEAYTSRQISFGNATNGEHVRIDANGNVGIGKLVPSADLDIEDSGGATLFMGDTNGRNLRFRTANSGSQNTNISSYAGLNLGGADNANHVLIDGDGDVGIGVTPATHARLTLGGTTASYSSSLAFDNNTTGGATFFMLASDNTWNAGGNKFLMGHGSPSSAAVDVTIDADGNVGIGTSSPDCALDITRTSGWAEVHFDGASGGDLILKDNGVNVGEIYAGVGHGMVLKSYSSQDMHFLTNASATPKMIIKSDGKVGIGETSPSAKLHLKKTAASTQHYDLFATAIIEDTEARLQLVATDGGSNAASLILSNEEKHWGLVNHGPSKSNTFGIGYYASSSSGIDISDLLSSPFTITTDGNVGIGGAPDSSGRLLVTNGGTNQIVLKGASGTTNLNMGNFVGGGYISNNYYYSSGHQADDNSKGAFEVFIGDENYGINYHAAGAAGTRRRDFAIDNTGKVGIGTSTPGSNHAKANNLVVGSGSAGGMAVYNGTNEGWYAFSRSNANNSDAYDGGISYNGNRDLKFHTNAGTTRMTIDGQGKIQIGNNIPMWSGAYGGALVLKGNNATSDRYAQLTVVDSNGSIAYTGLTVNNTGGVGVATTAAASNAKLNVAGGIRFNAFSAGHGLNTVTNLTFNNTNTYNACGSVYYKMFVVNIYHNNGHSQCFFVSNGGGGVGYNFTGIVPGNTALVTGTGINTTFTTIGSAPNTFTINISSGGGALSVRRTSGTGSFGVQVHALAGG